VDFLQKMGQMKNLRCIEEYRMQIKKKIFLDSVCSQRVTKNSKQCRPVILLASFEKVNLLIDVAYPV
jgi:hypothetical protein